MTSFSHGFVLNLFPPPPKSEDFLSLILLLLPNLTIPILRVGLPVTALSFQWVCPARVSIPEGCSCWRLGSDMIVSSQRLNSLHATPFDFVVSREEFSAVWIAFLSQAGCCCLIGVANILVSSLQRVDSSVIELISAGLSCSASVLTGFMST